VKILLCVDTGQCYDGKAGDSLLMEAQSKINEANNAEDGSAIECFRLRTDPLQIVTHLEILSGSVAAKFEVTAYSELAP